MEKEIKGKITKTGEKKGVSEATGKEYIMIFYKIGSEEVSCIETTINQRVEKELINKAVNATITIRQVGAKIYKNLTGIEETDEKFEDEPPSPQFLGMCANQATQYCLKYCPDEKSFWNKYSETKNKFIEFNTK